MFYASLSDDTAYVVGLPQTAFVVVSVIAIILIVTALLRIALSSQGLREASLFSKLFIVVAISSALFSAISSAIGFGLITSQETDDVFRNAILPPSFGLFVFFLASAIWIGGSEMVRNRDWFRGLGDKNGGAGFLGDMLHFAERCIKLFILMPILAAILFFISTWTSVVGIAGVDAVRHQYKNELARLQSECVLASNHRQRDLLFLDDLRASVSDVTRAAKSERETGGQTGVRGRGAATEYFSNVAAWLSSMEQSVASFINTPTGNLSPYQTDICTEEISNLQTILNANAYANYDLWARNFETGFESLRLTIDSWRRDTRIADFLTAQLTSFDRANPKPTNLSNVQTQVITDYSESVKSALNKLIAKQKRKRAARPAPSANDLSPSRGLMIFAEMTGYSEPPIYEKTRRSSAAEETVPVLAVITTRDAPLKFFNIFSDIWALSLCWDYASYVLLFAYLFFPSAERRVEYK